MGDVVELDRLLIESYGRAYRTAFLILRDGTAAEEAVQEAFLRVWRFRGAMPNDDGVRPWIYRVLVNTCYTQLRKEIPARERRGDADGLGRLEDPRRGPEEQATASSVADLVLESLADLPEPLRVVVVLRYWTGLSEKDIALAIRRRPGTVKSRLHEARRRLAADPRITGLGTNAEGVR